MHRGFKIVVGAVALVGAVSWFGLRDSNIDPTPITSTSNDLAGRIIVPEEEPISAGLETSVMAAESRGQSNGVPLVAKLVDPSTVPGLQAWIDSQFLLERPYVEDLRVVQIDNQPIMNDVDILQLQISSDEKYEVFKIFSQELPNGGFKWAGSIDRNDRTLVNLEVSEFGAVTARITSERERLFIRGSPMLPYHVMYTGNANAVKRGL